MTYFIEILCTIFDQRARLSEEDVEAISRSNLINERDNNVLP